MSGIPGTTIATIGLQELKAGSIPTAITPEARIWTTTARGVRFRITVPCGLLKWAILIGRPIATAVGFMSRITDGRGFPTSHGAGLLITTAGGSSMAVLGAGGRDRSS